MAEKTKTSDTNAGSRVQCEYKQWSTAPKLGHLVAWHLVRPKVQWILGAGIVQARVGGPWAGKEAGKEELALRVEMSGAGQGL